MFTTIISSRQAFAFVLPLFALLLLIGCGKNGTPPASTEQATRQTSSAQAVSSPDEPPAPSNGMVLPVGLTRDSGDLDAMVKRRNIRALILLNPIGFFYDKG